MEINFQIFNVDAKNIDVKSSFLLAADSANGRAGLSAKTCKAGADTGRRQGAGTAKYWSC
jgi:hypothetical protein